METSQFWKYGLKFETTMEPNWAVRLMPVSPIENTFVGITPRKPSNQCQAIQLFVDAAHAQAEECESNQGIGCFV